MKRKPDRNSNGTGSIFKRTIIKDKKKTTVWDVVARKPMLDENGEVKRDAKNRRIYKEKAWRCYTEAEALTKRANIPNYWKKEEEKEQQVLVEKQREKTFYELCDYFEQHKIVAPVYVGTIKIAGYTQNHQTLRSEVAEFKEFFGDVPLSQITYDSLQKYAATLSLTKTRNTKKEDANFLAAASINKRLALLRHIFNIAVEYG